MNDAVGSAPVIAGYLPLGLAVLVALAVGYRFALAHAAVSAASRARIRTLAEEGSRRAELLTQLLGRRDALQAALRLGFAGCVVLTAALSWRLAARLQADWGTPLWETALAGLLLVTVLSELVPRLLGTLRPESEALKRLRWIVVAQRLWGPFARAALGEPPPAKDDPDDEGTEESIRELVDTVPIHPHRRRRIAEILEFPDKTAGAVMIPRIDIVMVSRTTPLRVVAEKIVESGYSRLPVYGESRDDVIGLIYARDVLSALPDGGTAETLTRPALFVAESASLATLLSEMRSAHSSVAIAIDEYGGTAGLVAVEDVIEEIVGEIHDESDTTDVAIRPRPEGGWLVSARTELGELAEHLGCEVDDALDVNTVGGLLLALAGDLPEADEVFLADLQSCRLALMAAGVEGTRVTAVTVVRLPPAGETEEESAAPTPNETHDAVMAAGATRLAEVGQALGLDVEPELAGCVADLFACLPPEAPQRSVRWRGCRASVVSATDDGAILVRLAPER